MKIGILTFHRAHNYGAVLQCYALQEILKGMGHEVEVIDYRQPFIEWDYKIYRWDIIKSLLRHPFSLLHFLRKDLKQKKCRKANFNNFCTKYLNLTTSCSSSDVPASYDVYVIGSDQLWGINCMGGKLDPLYFGNFSHTKNSKVIGYAISTNEKSIRSIEQQQLSTLLNNFTSLSLREKSMSDLIYGLTGVASHVDLDPTLLLTRDKWILPANTDWCRKNYVLVYYVIRGFGEYAHQNLLEKAKRIAENIGAEVIDLTTLNATVEDFVTSFKYAKCVVTSSFHATVFSVIFNTPIYSVKLHDGSDGRYVSLLNTLNLNSSIVEMDDDIRTIPHIDYSIVNSKIEELRRPSIDYLINSLK